MKTIVQRNLDLTVCYNLIETKYIPLLDGGGATCDNCGHLLANIATIKSETTSKIYDIGFDCLDTILINNQILRGEDIEQYKACKKSLPKIKKIKEYFSKFIADNSLWINPIKKVELNTKACLPGWLTYYIYDSKGNLRWNDGTRIKDMHYPTLLATLKQIKGVEFVLIQK